FIRIHFASWGQNASKWHSEWRGARRKTSSHKNFYVLYKLNGWTVTAGCYLFFFVACPTSPPFLFIIRNFFCATSLLGSPMAKLWSPSCPDSPPDSKLMRPSWIVTCGVDSRVMVAVEG